MRRRTTVDATAVDQRGAQLRAPLAAAAAIHPAFDITFDAGANVRQNHGMTDPDRRTFLAVLGGAAASGCALLRGGAAHPRVSARMEGGLRIPLASAPQLQQPGGVVIVSPPGSKQSLLVARTADGYLAVSAECKHWGCTVDFNPAESTWDCPCHGSRYHADGRLLHGPATEGLESYSVRVEGEDLIVAI
jgi:nitrite reductase/ring-hydroxylating ferredoxin subunit